MKNLLLISPYFPPMAVIGAKRALNLSRHLPSCGWRPIILCSSPTREPVDPRLSELIGKDAIISPTYRRAKVAAVNPKPKVENLQSIPSMSLLEKVTGWQPKYLGPFDRELIEIPHAIREASRLIKEYQIEAVAVSADPWSALITASSVSKKFNLPLIVDFRDPWTLHSGKSKLRPPPTLAFMRWYERRLFSRAAQVILNTQSCEQAYRNRDGHLWPEDRLTFIRNAFDSTMFGDWSPPRPLLNRPFELVYFGKFRKFVRPDALFAGIATFIRKRELTPDQFKLVLIGGEDPYAHEAMQQWSLSSWIEIRPAVSFLDSFEVLQHADALALVDGGCPLVIAGKLYDYLSAGRPIISVARAPEVAQVIAESGAGVSSNPDQYEEIAHDLGQLYDQAHQGNFFIPNQVRLAPFDAPAQAKLYAQVLNRSLDC